MTQTVSNTSTLKDADQDAQLAVLTAKVDHIVDHSKEVTERVRKLEKWVAGAAAVVAVGGAFIGFSIAADAKPGEKVFIDAWAEKFRQYELERNLTSPIISIDGALNNLEENDDEGDKFVRSDDGMQVKSIFVVR